MIIQEVGIEIATYIRGIALLSKIERTQSKLNCKIAIHSIWFWLPLPSPLQLGRLHKEVKFMPKPCVVTYPLPYHYAARVLYNHY